jgi:hypothetical protein
MPSFWPAECNPEKFQILFIVTGLLGILLYLSDSRMIFCILAGVLFFIAMTFKQNAVPVILAIIAILPVQGHLVAPTAVILTMFSCYTTVFLYYSIKGTSISSVFKKFFFSPDLLYYIFELKKDASGEKVSSGSMKLLPRLMSNLKPVLKESSLLWIFSLAWLLHHLIISPLNPTTLIFLLVFSGTLMGFFAVNKFFPYYYIPFLPWISLPAGDIIMTLLRMGRLPAAATLIIAVILVGISIAATFRFFFRMTPFEQGNFMYSRTLYNFGASEEAGAYIREARTRTTHLRLQLNPMYFFAQRRCPANAVYLEKFSVAHLGNDMRQVEERALQRKLREAKPRYVVMNPDAGLTIGAFEKIIGERYFREKAWHAGYHFGVRPVSLEAYRRRDTREASRLNAGAEDLFGQGLADRAREGFLAALSSTPCTRALSNLASATTTSDVAKAFDASSGPSSPTLETGTRSSTSLDLPVTKETG